MFKASYKPVEPDYTLTAFLLAVAFVLVPAVAIFFRPLTSLSLGLAIAASASCLTVAGVNWRRSSKGPGPVLSTVSRTIR